MTSIIYIGMDVHTTSYSVCAYSMESQNIFAETSFTASAEKIRVSGAVHLDSPSQSRQVRIGSRGNGSPGKI